MTIICKGCGKEIKQYFFEYKKEWYCSIECAKGESGMKDYDREYSIQEVFEFDEGTEFTCKNIILTITEDNETGTKSLLMLDGKEEAILTNKWVNDKFKLKRKERKVDFMDAVKEYYKGETIKSVYKDAIGSTDRIYIQNGEGMINDKNDPISSTEIIKAEWFII